MNVVLVEPEIPPNTGNVARLCAATGSVLHLVHPLGFRIDDRHLRRAGLDYWPHVAVREHESLAAFFRVTAPGPHLFFSARGGRPYTEAPVADGAFLVFGKEATGLPADLLSAHRERTFRVPIWGRVRSLNLATAVGIVVYDAYRRLGFPAGA
ncbi:tRNA (cytidine(34)-2'-O)-methyltransferase [Dissulfurirhabdus thermomarina]|uniref:Putative tRNA (cytidine(34)-2'-O)-methyltransferase n=1 Tax=Dissulfurirhabdus thermomarina TaxID=1765737 RepID=A0A6N9TRT4_DISTH|nr:tRNA (cytidine(34)-2'-O)-methyltransferase [Dissulfurirhabdus thermomarina]NDY42464.1 tRNA (cytidine(34)-2'-O)-methyltransferase [Dissulfurirhabdus thermomarina]NMX23852.1 tRNA (cytidine(34)-2'-O)-methyltransferase [Dissulfurirhabdus thermomarina]